MNENLVTLMTMLSYRRPHESKGERRFINRYLRPLRPTADGKGNLIVVVGEKSKTLFSCHVDTVHNGSVLTQKVLYDKEKGILYKDDKQCLGADNGAGVWLLIEMIKAGVPGTYAFHRGEERGCIGSRWVADNRKDWLKTFDRAIAFDRRGCTSVITHQRSKRCCSDTFGKALADALGNGYVLDPGGIYTDTANYIDEVPECTNVSVGYANEHGGSETLDVTHLFLLRDLCVKLDWEALPIERKAGTTEWRSSSSSGWSGNSSAFGYEGGSVRRSAYRHGYDGAEALNYSHEKYNLIWGLRSTVDVFDLDKGELSDLCRLRPAFAAMVMWELIWGLDDEEGKPPPPALPAPTAANTQPGDEDGPLIFAQPVGMVS